MLSKILDFNCLILILATLLFILEKHFQIIFLQIFITSYSIVIFYLLKDTLDKFDLYGSFPVSIALF